MHSYLGMRIIENESLVVPDGEDWSKVRSPARARRRRKKHRQNIEQKFKPDPRAYKVGDTLIMHPAMARELKKEVDRRNAISRSPTGADAFNYGMT